jgi:hypothetical protein
MLGQEVDSWKWVGKRWKRNRVKHKQKSMIKTSWDRKSIVRSGWRRDGREIESNTSRQSMIKKAAGTGS